MSRFDNYKKDKDFLVCIDSDGCAMDTMNWKHIHCFGPMFVTFWNLTEHEKTALDIWNKINLFSKTRGVNRFIAVVTTLEALESEGIEVEDFTDLKEWITSAKELSNPALKREIELKDSEQLKKTLDWSMAVNKSITQMADRAKPFDNVLEAFKAISESADIAGVSSANKKALEDEWNEFGLDKYTKIICSQEEGTKAYCISELLKKGYSREKILMIGDAPGDLKAAENNSVLFYPILSGQEDVYWKNVYKSAIIPMMNGSFDHEKQQHFNNLFYKNLE